MKKLQLASLTLAALLLAGCGASAASTAESTSEAVSTEETAPAATAAPGPCRSGGLGFRDGRGRGRGGGRGGSSMRPPRTCSRRSTLRNSTAARQRRGSESQDAWSFSCFPSTSFYIYIYQALAGGGAGRDMEPLRCGGASHRTQAGHTQPCRAFPKTPRVTLQAEWVFLSRSGNQWARHGDIVGALDVAESGPDLNMWCATLSKQSAALNWLSQESSSAPAMSLAWSPATISGRRMANSSAKLTFSITASAAVCSGSPSTVPIRVS